MDNSISKWNLPPGFIRKRNPEFAALAHNAWFLFLLRHKKSIIPITQKGLFIWLILICEIYCVVFIFQNTSLWYYALGSILILEYFKKRIKRSLFAAEVKNLIGIDNLDLFNELSLTRLTPTDFYIANLAIKMSWKRIIRWFVISTIVYSILYVVFFWPLLLTIKILLNFFLNGIFISTPHLIEQPFFIPYFLGYLYFCSFALIRLIILDAVMLNRFCKKLTKLYFTNYPEEKSIRAMKPKPMYYISGNCNLFFVLIFILLFSAYYPFFREYDIELWVRLFIGSVVSYPILFVIAHAYELYHARMYFQDECRELTDWLLEEYKEKYVAPED